MDELKKANVVIEKTFEARNDALHEVLSFVEEELEKRFCNMKTQMMISVMVEEIFVNIASYAYPDSKGTATIKLEFDDENNVTISFIDSGIPFNPLAKKDPDITLSAEERDIGGLGIYMVKKSMDDVSYTREDNKNILSIKKGLYK